MDEKMAVKPKRQKLKVIPSLEEIQTMAQECKKCMECVRSCPNGMDVQGAVLAAATGNFEPLKDIYNNCIGCARCESACPNDYFLHSWMVAASQTECDQEKWLVRKIG